MSNRRFAFHPERAPGAGTKRQILSTRKPGLLDRPAPGALGALEK